MKVSIAERLAAGSVRTESGCLEWVRHRNWRGYGIIGRDGRSVGAHRAAYEVAYGPIPAGLEIDHLCRNRACIEPTHLEAVTHIVNLRRSIRTPASTFKCGHDRTPENSKSSADSRGGPYFRCRTCFNAARRGKPDRTDRRAYYRAYNLIRRHPEAAALRDQRGAS